MVKCKICNSDSNFFDKNIVLKKYEINYFICSNCKFIQVENPFWLEEAYSDAINSTDVGYVYRNTRLAKVLNLLIYFSFNKKAKYLDYGAGYGLFVRLMRDYGYDFYWDDLYCENIFAKNFELNNLTNRSFELITAFELFEHLVNPICELEKMLSYSGNILISTDLYPKSNPKSNDWWYFGLEHGQHISIYNIETFKFIAKKYNLKFYTNGKNLHLLSNKNINNYFFKLLGFYYLYISRRPLSPVKTLLNSDYELILNKMNSEN
ncbi:MAG: class I SAM-dependent methyltransferase [Ignavibacteria bacterium]|nr:class I SAM-dependent methyltransferase [Ignavibacteria bacterium]